MRFLIVIYSLMLLIKFKNPMATEHGMLVLYCFKNRFNVVAAFVTVFETN